MYAMVDCRRPGGRLLLGGRVSSHRRRPAQRRRGAAPVDGGGAAGAAAYMPGDDAHRSGTHHCADSQGRVRGREGHSRVALLGVGGERQYKPLARVRLAAVVVPVATRSVPDGVQAQARAPGTVVVMVLSHGAAHRGGDEQHRQYECDYPLHGAKIIKSARRCNRLIDALRL